MWRILYISFIIIGYVNSLTDEEVKINFTKLVMKCLKDHPVDMEDLNKLQNLIVPTKYEVKCLLACAYRAEGVMTDKGIYDKEKAYQMAGRFMDEQKKANAKKFVDICVKVNEVEVADGDKGCERAALLLKCTIDNGPKLGFKV